MEKSLVELCKLRGKQLRLIYRATRDGFDASNFHAKCDNQPNTLTLIKTTKECIFGGYTAVAWDSISCHKADPTAFIFSLTNSSKNPLKIPIKTNNARAIYCCSSHGPVFGSYDICIQSNSNVSNGSYSELGNSFDFKLDSHPAARAQSFLADSQEFKTVEIEVFNLISI